MRTTVSAAFEQRLDEDKRGVVVLHQEHVQLGLVGRVEERRGVGRFGGRIGDTHGGVRRRLIGSCRVSRGNDAGGHLVLDLAEVPMARNVLSARVAGVRALGSRRGSTVGDRSDA